MYTYVCILPQIVPLQIACIKNKSHPNPTLHSQLHGHLHKELKQTGIWILNERAERFKWADDVKKSKIEKVTSLLHSHTCHAYDLYIT